MRESVHEVVTGDATELGGIAQGSVELVVTSPPYPMIEMWDAVFGEQSADARRALEARDGPGAFEAMHCVLDAAWGEVHRVLRPGGIACINIGDATRTIEGHFRLYPNHARILSRCMDLGFTNLPAVIWRKQTNAPNKFMGSGMLPAGAYVTLEHEFILILRKGAKREFKTVVEKRRRAESALFWEERNAWFSDVWMDLKGTDQGVSARDARKRSGAFPFEVAYRLVNMYSVKGDTVLDPFAGTGTTMHAAIASNRNSIGVEIDGRLAQGISAAIGPALVGRCNGRVDERLERHRAFVQERKRVKGDSAFKHRNEQYGFEVVSGQEARLVFDCLESVEQRGDSTFVARYARGAGDEGASTAPVRVADGDRQARLSDDP